MPVRINRGPETYVQLPMRRAVAGEELPEQSWWAELGDAFATESWMAPIKDQFEQTNARNSAPRVPGFDPLDHVPKGYEEYADAYAFAWNMEEVAKITENIAETNAARRRRAEVGLGDSLLQSLAVGLVDPVNAIPIPGLAGAGFLKGMLRGGTAIGTINLVTETVRHTLDPTSTFEQTAINVGAGYFLGGLIAGGIGKFTRAPDARAGNVRIEGGRVNMTPEQRASVGGAERRFEQAMRAADGVMTDELIDFANQPVRIIVGPTGKTDAAGNPVLAFLRRKETFEAAARAEQVSRAADSALGDVIPGRVDGGESTPEAVAEIFETLRRLEDDAMRGAGEPLDEADAAIPMGRGADDPAAADAPQGARRGEETAQKAGQAAEPEDTVFIDVDGLKASFASKPWARPRVEGVEPLPEDAFKNVNEWVNFVTLHELHHVFTKRKPTQTKAEYENYINQLAYQEMKAGRLPMAPTDSFLEKMALLFSPIGQLQRMTNSDGKILGFAQALAGDFEVMNIANNAGVATPVSANLRALRWQAHFGEASVALRQAYLKYWSGAGSDSRIVTNTMNMAGSLPVVGAAGRQGKMGLDEFMEYVGRATFDDGPFALNGRALSDEDMAIVREAAAAQRKFYQAFEKDIRELEMFSAQKRAKWEIDWRQEKIDEIKAKLDEGVSVSEGQREAWESLINEWDRELADLLDLVDELPEGSDLQAAAESLAKQKQRGIKTMEGRLAGKPFERLPPVMSGMVRVWRVAKGDIAGKAGNYTTDGAAAKAQAKEVKGEVWFADLPADHPMFAKVEWDGDAFAPGQGAAGRLGADEVTPQRVRDYVMSADDLGPRTAGQVDGLRSRLNEMDFKLAATRERLGRLSSTPPKQMGNDGYWHRLYHVGKIKERYDDFVKLIGFGFARETGDETAVTPEILARAKKVADNIIGEGGEPAAYGIGGPRALASRVIPLSDKELADFIVLDAEQVALSYVRRMAPSIELHRMFGSQTLDKQIAELKLYMADKGYSPKKQQDVLWIIEAQRDRVLNRFHAKDTQSWDNRTARAAMMMGNMTTLGTAVFSQTTELFRTLAVEGFAPAFRAFSAMFDEGLKDVSTRNLGRHFGEGWDMAMARALARSMEDDSATIATKTTKAERALARAQPWFFTMNLMTPFNVLVKDGSSFSAAHRIIEDSRTIAKAIEEGRTPDTFTKAEKKLAARMASWGINPRTAQAIAAQPVDVGKRGLIFPKVDEWEGPAGAVARDAFAGALQGYLRSNIITPSPLTRPAIMDGMIQVKEGGLVSRTLGDGSDRLELALLGPVFQLLSFPLTSSAKITHSLLSGRERSTFGTFIALLAGGYVSAKLAADDAWDYMDWKEKIYAAIDKSGLTAYALDPIKRFETLTGYGPRAALGMEPFGNPDAVAPKVGAVAGPAAGILTGMVEALTSEDMTDNQRADGVRRAIPFSGMLWFDESAKNLSRWIASSGAFEFEDIGAPSAAPETEEAVAEIAAP